jgi:hypothetical protein
MIMNSLQRLLLLCICGFALVAHGFVSPVSHSRVAATSPFCSSSTCQSTSSLHANLLGFEGTASSSTNLAATTLDPTTFLSDLLGGFINSNLILLVPIVAALALASLVAFAIVSYANPAEPDED